MGYFLALFISFLVVGYFQAQQTVCLGDSITVCGGSLEIDCSSQGNNATGGII